MKKIKINSPQPSINHPPNVVLVDGKPNNPTRLPTWNPESFNFPLKDSLGTQRAALRVLGNPYPGQSGASFNYLRDLIVKEQKAYAIMAHPNAILPGSISFSKFTTLPLLVQMGWQPNLVNWHTDPLRLQFASALTLGSHLGDGTTSQTVSKINASRLYPHSFTNTNSQITNYMWRLFRVAGLISQNQRQGRWVFQNPDQSQKIKVPFNPQVDFSFNVRTGGFKEKKDSQGRTSLGKGEKPSRKSWSFNFWTTYSYPENEWRTPLYKNSLKNPETSVKAIPNNIGEFLWHPLTLAIWYLGDGSHVSDRYSVNFSLKGYTQAEADLLAQALYNNFGLVFTIIKSKNNPHRLNLIKDGCQWQYSYFHSLVYPWIQLLMKLSPQYWNNKRGFFKILGPIDTVPKTWAPFVPEDISFTPWCKPINYYSPLPSLAHPWQPLTAWEEFNDLEFEAAAVWLFKYQAGLETNQTIRS